VVLRTAIQVASINIEGRKHLDLVYGFLTSRQFDCIFLQEVFKTDLELLARKLNMQVVFEPMHTIHGDPEGIGILTHLPIESRYSLTYVGDPKNIVEFDHADPNGVNRVLSGIECTISGQRCHLIHTHFTWTPDGRDTDLQHLHLEKLLAGLRGVDNFILLGDFNAPRGGPIFDKFSSLYKDNIPQDTTTTIDGNIHRCGDLQLVVDGFFSSRSMDVSDVKVLCGVSDHCAIIGSVAPTLGHIVHDQSSQVSSSFSSH
jgi:endonuclease/exonuclease/phosphatase family metal-dependent hydrolase